MGLLLLINYSDLLYVSTPPGRALTMRGRAGKIRAYVGSLERGGGMRRKAKAKAGDARRAVGYVRISVESGTEDQALGPAAQREALAVWARKHRVELVAVHEDLGISGGAELDRRPGLLAALDTLAAARAGVLL